MSCICEKCGRKLIKAKTFKGYEFVVAEENSHLLEGGWSQRILKYGIYIKKQRGYKKNRKTYYLHREIMQPPKNMVVDHIDGNPQNNCPCNLRIITSAKNKGNRWNSSNNTGHPFIHKSLDNNYVISVNNIQITAQNLQEAIDWRNGLRNGSLKLRNLRKITKNRQNRRGKFNYSLKLVEKIRNEYKKFKCSKRSLARKYDVGKSTVAKWLKGVI